ncbi:MAG: hypothetical protein RSC10_01670 [Longicatena sp.]
MSEVEPIYISFFRKQQHIAIKVSFTRKENKPIIYMRIEPLFT